MQLPRTAYWWCAATILVMALSLGPSFAHLLEAPPRLATWTPELWRETTTFNGQFMWFAIVGGPLDVSAILSGAAMAFLLRRERTPFRLALAAAFAVRVKPCRVAVGGAAGQHRDGDVDAGADPGKFRGAAQPLGNRTHRHDGDQVLRPGLRRLRRPFRRARHGGAALSRFVARAVPVWQKRGARNPAGGALLEILARQTP